MAAQSQSTPPRNQGTTQNLWQKALASLDEELRVTLDFNRSSKLNILQKTLETAEQKKQLCLWKRWKFERHGKQIVLRDVLEKIIKWVDRFKAIGDIAAQADPAHASLPWACVRFLLQVAISEGKVFETTIAGLEAISHLIARYAIFEDVHLKRNTAASAELEPALTALYAEILVFLARSKRYFQTQSTVRIVKSAFQVDQDKYLQSIRDQESKVAAIASLSDATLLNRLHELERPINRIADQAAVYERTQKEERYREILNWLSPIPFKLHHKQLAKNRLQHSGEWLLNHGDYMEWKASSTSSFFLLYGSAGSGKSSLASAIVDSFLLDAASQTSPAPIAYFYCTKTVAESMRGDPDEILRSVLRQLSINPVHKSVHSVVDAEYKRREAEALSDGFEVQKLDGQTCVKLILDITALNPATIIIDAIDEIPPPRRYELIQGLKTIRQDSGSVVKVFMTSRNDGQINTLLSDEAVEIQINASNNESDIRSFVHRHVSLAISSCNLLNGRVAGDLHADLERSLVQSAGESFRLVELQIQNLCLEVEEEGLRRAMQRLPKDTLDGLYSDSYMKICSAGLYARKIAMNTFALLLCQREVLSVNAFLAAVVPWKDATQRSGLQFSDLLRICRDMIILDSHMNVIRFVHVSVQEFLEGQQDLATERANQLIALSCINYCTFGSSIKLDSGIRSTEQFSHYATMYWAEHYRAAATPTTSSDLFESAKDFVFEDDELSLSFIGWLEDVQDYSRLLPEHHSLKKDLSAVSNSTHTFLFTACVFGLTDLLNHMPRASDFDWSRTNDSGQTGLYLASAVGHQSVLQILLDNGASVSASGGKLGTPLQAACFHGHSAIAGLLLESGADARASGKFENALHAAVKGGNEDIALLILERDFKINSENEYDLILQDAAQAGQVAGVQRLQKLYGPAYDKSGQADQKAVVSAIFKGQLGVLQRFLSRNPEAKSALPVESISIAALGGHNQATAFLLDLGLDIEHEGQFGSPLRVASVMGHEAAVRLLLDRGANAIASGTFGDALQAAAMKGHVSVVKMIIRNGVDPRGYGPQLEPALHSAAYYGHVDVVILLLESGANVHSKAIFKDAFHAAADGGNEKVIRLLTEKGYKLPHPFSPTFRHMAKPRYPDLLREASPSRSQREDLARTDVSNSSHLRYLLPDSLELHPPKVVSRVYEMTRSRPIFKPNCSPFNHALTDAALLGHVDIVAYILDQWDFLGADLLSEEAGLALVVAATNGHMKVVEIFIISKRINFIDAVEALEAAASEGYLPVTETLLPYLSEIRPTIELDASEGQPDKARYPVSAHQNVSSDTKITVKDAQFERRMLVAACRGDQAPVVKKAFELLGHLSTSEEQANARLEALNIACRHDTGETIRIILDNADFGVESLRVAFRSACGSGSSRAILPLLQLNNKHFLGCTELSQGIILTSGHGHLDVFQLLINRLKVSDMLQSTLDIALHIASLNGHSTVVEALLREGADPNIMTEEPKNEDPRGVEYHRDGGFESGRKRTSLQAAINGIQRVGYIFGSHSSWRTSNNRSDGATVLLLLDGGADLNIPYDSSLTLMQKAVQCCSETIVQAMIDRGASILDPLTTPSEPDASNTSLSKIVGTESTAVQSAKSLQKGSSKVPSVSRSASTLTNSLLEIACDRNYGALAVVEVLLQAGAHIPECESGKKSILEIAANRGRGACDLVKILLHAGAQLPKYELGKNPVLNAVLRRERYQPSRRTPFEPMSSSVSEVLNNDAGAVVKTLLPYLPLERADDKRYDLLFQMAIISEDRDCINLLLDRGVDVNAEEPRNEYYYGTPLQCAARTGNMDLVQLLLRLGADVNLLAGAHDTAIRAAVIGSHENVINILLEHGADVNLRSSEQDDYHGQRSEPILQLSLANFNPSVFESLLRRGADVNAALEYDMPVLTRACQLGNIEAVKVLLDMHADVNALGGRRPRSDFFVDAEASALHMACDKGLEVIAENLIERGADIELVAKDSDVGTKRHHSRTPLQVAAHWGRTSIVRLLVQSGAEVDRRDYFGSTALSIASTCSAISSERNRIELIEELLGAQATIASSSLRFNALAEACRSSSHEITGLLLEEISGTPVEKYACDGALSSAASRKDDEIFQMLVERGGVPSSSTIFQACAAGLEGSVLKLLDCGIDIDSDDDDGARAIHVASFERQEHVVEVLLRRGAQIYFVSKKYGTPLQAVLEGFIRAYPRGKPEYSEDEIPRMHSRTDVSRMVKTYNSELSACEHIAHLLIGHGAEVDIDSFSIPPPLHLASFIGSIALIGYLLEKGANLCSISDRFGTTLIAALQGHHKDNKTIECLLNKGIDINYISPTHGSPLIYAITHLPPIKVKFLLTHGADVNARGAPHGNGNGNESPLSIALTRDSAGRIYRKRNEEILPLLLESPTLRIQQQDLLTAISLSNAKSGKDYIALLLDHDKDLVVSEATILAAIRDTSRRKMDFLRRLLPRLGGTGVIGGMIEAVSEVEVMRELLRLQPWCRITPEVLSKVGGKENGEELLMVLVPMFLEQRRGRR